MSKRQVPGEKTFFSIIEYIPEVLFNGWVVVTMEVLNERWRMILDKTGKSKNFITDCLIPSAECGC